ncbi:MAG TPA: hypothetical protein H9821_04900 [Candidatus Rothia avicola]|uniref:Uncharacterized protein n=1 Tax=Candidatus Rothia avicola TaxID=2840478 RepID=A0A9D1ZSN8_9MICC|nr:hypothetical protein [Candidatus Rothia avicola]
MNQNRKILIALNVAILVLSVTLVIMQIVQGNTGMAILWGVLAIANAATLVMHLKAGGRNG